MEERRRKGRREKGTWTEMRTVAISEPASWMTKGLCPCLHPLSFRLVDARAVSGLRLDHETLPPIRNAAPGLCLIAPPFATTLSSLSKHSRRWWTNETLLPVFFHIMYNSILPPIFLLFPGRLGRPPALLLGVSSTLLISTSFSSSTAISTEHSKYGMTSFH